jgi:hypothetical protein
MIGRVYVVPATVHRPGRVTVARPDDPVGVEFLRVRRRDVGGGGGPARHRAGRALGGPRPHDRTTIIYQPSRNVLSISDNGEIVVAPARLAGRPPPG